MPKRGQTFLNILIMLTVIWSVDASAASGTKADGELKDVERALKQDKKKRDVLKKKSLNLARDLGSLKREMVTVAAAVQNQEAAILALEDSLVELAEREKTKLALLGKKRHQLGFVLMALQKIARQPPEAMIVSSMSPAETVRGAILLRAAVPTIEDRASILRNDLSSLIEARKMMVEKRQLLASARAGLDAKHLRLDGLLSEKTRLKKKTDSRTLKAEKRIRTLVKKAKSLRDLMRRLEADRVKQQETESKTARTAAPKIKKKPVPSIHKARGTLPYPAVGRLVGRYGQAMNTGITRKGITIETGPAAQVVIPHEGTVVFAGLFKGYGQLLIIEHGEGYHSLLAGLARIDNVIGQQVLSGEPAGIMGNSKKTPPVLYVELRRNGQPINPLPWLAKRKIKVNG